LHYLAKHPELLDDFIDFGTNIHYEVLAAMSPALLARDKSLLNELEMREFEPKLSDSLPQERREKRARVNKDGGRQRVGRDLAISPNG